MTVRFHTSRELPNIMASTCVMHGMHGMPKGRRDAEATHYNK